MIDSRSSTATQPNRRLAWLPRSAGESNSSWLARSLRGSDSNGAVVLIGGTNLTHFRLRIAQAHLRNDLTPNHWSHAVLVGKAKGASDWSIEEVSLEPPGGFGAVPPTNGVQVSRFSAYDDPVLYPNIACLRIGIQKKALGPDETFATAIRRAVDHFKKQRHVIDTGALICEWLGFAWGVDDKSNPLFRGMGIPSGVFLESVFSILGIELTPGLASRASCPEAIWQAAKWWHEFYDSEATVTSGPMDGDFFIGQDHAALTSKSKKRQSARQRAKSSRSRKGSSGRP